MNTNLTDPAEIEEAIKLKKNFLAAASLVAGRQTSSPAATRVAGNEAASLKAEIAVLEESLGAVRVDKKKGD